MYIKYVKYSAWCDFTRVLTDEEIALAEQYAKEHKISFKVALMALQEQGKIYLLDNSVMYDQEFICVNDVKALD